MKKIVILMSLCIIFIMQSCISDQDPVLPEIQKTEPDISHMVVKFEDRVYETDVMTVGDSTIYLNEEFAEIYKSKIVGNQNIAAIISSDEEGTDYIEYFSSEKQLVEEYNFYQMNGETAISYIETRGHRVIDMWPPNPTSKLILGVAELYDDTEFGNPKLISYACDTWATAIPRLKDIGFNDKTSAIKVFNKMNPFEKYSIRYIDDTTKQPLYRTHIGKDLRPVLKCYHNSDFSGAVLYCIAPPTGSSEPHADKRLKKIGWNDRISAIEWLIVFDFSLFEGDNPLIPAHPAC